MKFSYETILCELARLRASLRVDNIRQREILEETITIVKDSRDYEADVAWLAAPITVEEQSAITASYTPTDLIYDIDLDMYVELGQD